LNIIFSVSSSASFHLLAWSKLSNLEYIPPTTSIDLGDEVYGEAAAYLITSLAASASLFIRGDV
jgi:hypothetical protein